MCGIYGFQAVPNKDFSVYESTVISHILSKEMESRGRDSFGGITLDDGQIYKGLGRVSDNAIKLLRAASNAKSFLGHTRAATVGDISTRNCHPFRVGDIIGVHNGSIYNYKTLNAQYSRECEVDSEHIFYHLNEGLPLTDIEGYGTFFWSKESEAFSKIYFGKTYTGSLTIAKLYRGSPKEEDNEPIAAIWCSEQYPIRKVAAILGLEFVEIETKPQEIFYVQSGEVFNTHEPFDIIPSSWANYNKSTSNTTNSSNITNCGSYSYPGWCGEDDDEAEVAQAIIMSRSLGNSSTSSSEEEDTDVNEDLANGRLSLLTTGPIMRGLALILGDRSVSKKERKSIRRKLCRFRDISRSRQKDPTEENIHNGMGLKKFYRQGEYGMQAVFTCPGCNCDVDRHLWGWCQDDPFAKCRAKINEGCENEQIPICSDCGHYLVEGLHAVDKDLDNALICTACGDYCLSDSHLFEKFRNISNSDAADEG